MARKWKPYFMCGKCGKKFPKYLFKGKSLPVCCGQEAVRATTQAKRAFVLGAMGFSSYQEYLRSPKWRQIRDAILKENPVCEMCKTAPSSVVHHRSYSDDVTNGVDPSLLTAMCRPCHKTIEFREDGRKVTLKNANRRLARMTVQTKPVENAFYEEPLSDLDREYRAIVGVY